MKEETHKADTIRNRRKFLGTLSALGTGAASFAAPSVNMPKAENLYRAQAKEALSGIKITRIRFYEAPSRSMLNQSAHVVTVETDQGITGIGEGGTAFLVSQMAGLLIGKTPYR
ncbi:hypothetical protein WJR50_17480 [Catalinimonas sp. 4WD22]|uniref:hypothetical protein n=1 Tax=Catalinimonas locisalis TaxID=3133978 RepID=UPI0031013EC7